MTTRLYVYAFAGAHVPAFTMRGRRVHTVDVAGVHVVADREIPDAQPSEEALRWQHAIVESIAARTAAVLPARFGSLVEAGELARALAAHREAVRAALDTVRGRQQMTLRLTGVTVVPGEVAGGSGTAYLAGKRAALAQPEPALLGAVRTAVGALVRAEAIQPGRGGLRPIVFHLVDRKDAGDYRARVDALAAARAGGALTVSGPWPPFAFTPELRG